MSDDSDLMIAAAATAALVTWMGTRSRQHRRRAAGRPPWRAWWRAFRAGVARSWRETPAYLIVTGIRDAFFRQR